MAYFVFIVNPTAGKGQHTQQLQRQIREAFAHHPAYEIHLTR